MSMGITGLRLKVSLDIRAITAQLGIKPYAEPDAAKKNGYRQSRIN